MTYTYRWICSRACWCQQPHFSDVGRSPPNPPRGNPISVSSSVSAHLGLAGRTSLPEVIPAVITAGSYVERSGPLSNQIGLFLFLLFSKAVIRAGNLWWPRRRRSLAAAGAQRPGAGVGLPRELALPRREQQPLLL